MSDAQETTESLFHVKRTVTDFLEDKSGATKTTDILGTFTSLPAAKLSANSALASEGYLRDDFELYEAKNEIGAEKWTHADGVLVFAKAPAGQEFEVRLDTKPNVFNLKGNNSGEVDGHLHYVLQTTIDYTNDRIGSIQTTEVAGTYTTRKEALESAKNCLLDGEVTKESFAEYDEKEAFPGEWPYGDDCIVHAVGSTGDNFKVLVKAQPKRNSGEGKQHAARKSLV